MNNQIVKLVDVLSKACDINFENDKVYELSVYICVKYAIMSQKESHASDSIHFYSVLSTRYPKLLGIYENVEMELEGSSKEITCILLALIENDEEDAIVISDIYQHIKSYLLSTHISHKTDISKKSGKELLYQTQFFTDSYMVDYLIDKLFEIYVDLDNTLFVDPASGGGNFLALIYLRLYNWYHNKGVPTQQISRIIFNRNILGYDLDAELSEIASLSLFVLAYNHDGFESVDTVYNFGGVSDDYKGYFNNTVISNYISETNFEGVLNAARRDGRKIAYVTNPPFMGKRDMDSKLKAYLQSHLPITKGDMCFSFMLRIMKDLRQEDSFAVVAQNGWMNLSSLYGFREYILNNLSLLNCIDLGSNAFKNINGEKTNVVLAVFTKNDSSFAKQISTFGNLRSLSLSDKIKSLKSANYQVYNLDIKEFKKNSKYEFNYQLGDDIQIFAKYDQYGCFAKCMQGTSTGDNQTMVKYIWEIDSPEWKLASKGGGFSKWEGLNIYKVKWGENGECIKNQKGGVLRNPKEITSTQLVFSDTGTLGLNIRIKLENQVFMASGPGIKVLRGDVYCHLAFLNSKLASYLMKIINPKFTISGGYIQKLPVAKGILENDEIRTLSKMCLDLKHVYLRNKLPNVEYKHVDYNTIVNVQSYIESCIRSDFQNMYERLVAERLIDSLILSEYKLSMRLKQDYHKYMSGYEEHDDISKFIDIKMIDMQISKMIGTSCFPLGKKIEGKLIGSENCLEILSYLTKSSGSRLIECIYSHAYQLEETIRIYKNDFVHKVILHLCGIENLSHTSPMSINIEELNDLFISKYPLIYNQLKIDNDVLTMILTEVHNKVFFNKPILTIE